MHWGARPSRSPGWRPPDNSITILPRPNAAERSGAKTVFGGGRNGGRDGRATQGTDQVEAERRPALPNLRAKG